MKLQWTEPARDDRRVIRDYIALDNPAAAIDLDERLSKGAGQLAEQPDSGRPGRVAGTREWVVHRHYIIIYDVLTDAETVQILRVLHTSRRWP